VESRPPAGHAFDGGVELRYLRRVPQKYATTSDVATLVHHRGPTTMPGTPPSTGQGHTIVCLHDAGGNGNRFAELMDHLATGNSPIAYDQPGHGRSGGLDSVGSIPAMVDHLRALAGGWSLGPVVLLGEGMGAAVAAQAAADDPEWVTALVLVGGAAASFRVEPEIERLSAVTAGRARRQFDRSGYAPGTDRSVYQRAFGEWVKTDPRATLGDRRAQGSWALDHPPDVPALVVIGEHEEPATAGPAQELAAQLPQAAVHRLAGAGRHGVLEQPKALASAVEEHLAAVAGGAEGGRA
jgi:pimeloyl-ACP methyl ester carboxylesterase